MRSAGKGARTVQLELDLTLPPACRPEPEEWRYHFTRQGLVEQVGATRCVYGSWGRLFGCWEVGPDAGKVREIVPEWQVFDKNGLWLPPQEVSHWYRVGARGRRQHPQWRYDANLAFAAFFSEVPANMRRLVTPLCGHQWVALDMAWQVPGFATFVDEQIHAGHVHYLSACFSLGDVTARGRAERRAFADRMMRTRQRDFLAEVSGQACTKSTLRVLSRLAPGHLEAEHYEAAVALMAEPDTAKLLRHMASVTPDALDALAYLPGIALLPNVVALCADPDEGLGNLALIQASLHAMPIRLWPRAAAGLRHVTDSAALIAWRDRWSVRVGRLEPLPPPPIPGDRRLRPLSTIEALCEEALFMRNCLHTCEEGVREGHAYYYRWEGEERATVKLAHDADGWELEEALGADNEEIDEGTWSEIAAVVDGQLNRRRAWSYLFARWEAGGHGNETNGNARPAK